MQLHVMDIYSIITQIYMVTLKKDFEMYAFILCFREYFSFVSILEAMRIGMLLEKVNHRKEMTAIFS